MSKTIVIELPIACANQVRIALKKSMEKVITYHSDESAEDNYVKGAKFAYLDCAVSAIEEAIKDD